MNIDELFATLQNLKIYVSAREISSIWGMDEASFSRKKRDKTEIKQKNIEQLESAYNIDLTGKNNKTKIKADYYYDVFGSCGSGVFVLSECKRPIDVPVEIINNFSKFSKYSVINAIGDSMLPYIHNKDLLIVEHTTEIKDNQIYVFCYNDTIYVKRLVKNINKLVIISDNPNKDIYENIVIEKEQINDVIIIGQIVGLMRQCK